MPSTVCRGCRKFFEDAYGSGYKNHLKRCGGSKEETASLGDALLASRLRREKREDENRQAEQKAWQEAEEAAQNFGAFEDDLPIIPGLQSARVGLPFAQQQPTTSSSGRLQRSATARRAPARYRDPAFTTSGCVSKVNVPPVVPQTGPCRQAEQAVEPESVVARENDMEMLDGSVLSTQLPSPARYRTPVNSFGVFREYLKKPLKIPDDVVPIEDLFSDEADPMTHITPSDSEPPSLENDLYPFPNTSSFLLSQYHTLNSGNLSVAGLQRLIDDVITLPDFSPDDLKGVKIAALEKKLDELDSTEGDGKDAARRLKQDGWKECKVPIRVPTLAATGGGDNERCTKWIPYDATFTSTQSHDFHYEPYYSYRSTTDPSGTPIEERIHDELYASDAWMEEQIAVLALEGDDLPRAIAALMFASDATHVSQFGQSKFWPIYLFFGNLSKWFRCRPSTRSCHHIAHIPSLADRIQEIICGLIGKNLSQETLRHCRRELFQAVWTILLDPEFIHAYHHGIVIECSDGVTRRIFPRIFTYSADYPEKVLIATIRQFGSCPCPLCYVKKGKIYLLGMPSDAKTRLDHPRVYNTMVRRKVAATENIIYEQGFAPGNSTINDILQELSLVPTKNTFAEKLRDFESFDVYRMLPVDLMHEFELGVWKDVFTHLVRILYTSGNTTINEFNARFRRVGNFGRATIRSFQYMNVTDMKNWAARTYEDCLQSIIPCIEGLLSSPHDESVKRLLFVLATWHGLAKLRQHTDTTLALLDDATKRLGRELRSFAAWFSEFDTRETPKESEARKRRDIAQQKLSSDGAKVPSNSTSQRKQTTAKKTFSLQTVKEHLLGHYTATIRRYGTTDSFSTQISELEHRVVKSLYRKGSKKQATYVQESTRLQRRQQQVHRITDSAQEAGLIAVKTHPNRPIHPPARPIRAEEHHSIATNSQDALDIGNLRRDHPGDPAYEYFIEDLQDHLIARLRNDNYEREISDVERSELIIRKNFIYRHAGIRINYTTYDVYRDQDVIRPHVLSRSFVMVAAPLDVETQFWYAQVLGIYHVDVFHLPTHERRMQTMQFLHVRWLVEDEGHTGSFAECRLDRLSYVPSARDAFGFLDPSLVVRGAFLIPGFHWGRTGPRDSDWDCYYAMRFVDRDMLVRYLGCGIGHAQPNTPPNLPNLVADPNVGEGETYPGDIAEEEARVEIDDRLEDDMEVYEDEDGDCSDNELDPPVEEDGDEDLYTYDQSIF